MTTDADKVLSPSKKKNYADAVRAVLSVVICIAVILLCVYAVLRTVNGTQARSVLHEARLMRLASDSVAKTFYANGVAFADVSSFSGVTSQAEQQIFALSQCEGVFRILSYDTSLCKVTSLLYESSGFSAIMSTDRDGVVSWKVYKEKVYISD
jgi:LytS/YehU family sensor histidine kinase